MLLRRAFGGGGVGRFFLLPWTFSVHDFEPITGRIHQQPSPSDTLLGFHPSN